MRRTISLLLLLAATSTTRGADAPPNFVYIMADELGYFELSCMGNPNIQTPNIDRMAREGIRFTQALAGSSLCAPTRAVLMTGKHSGHTSVRTNGGGTPLRAEEKTVASVLKEKGYSTGGFGKWGCGGRGSTGVPEKHGFDVFLGYYDQVHAHSYYPPYIIRNSEEIPLAGNEGGSKGKVYSHYVIFEEAIKFIKENKNQPFYCYLPITPPHGIFDIPDDDPAWKLYKDKPLPEQAKRFAAMVTMVDRQVGEVLALLEELKLEKNTLVFFSGDNGGNDYFKDQGHPRGFHGANVNPKTGVEFRGKKGNLYEGGLRIPMIARWPGKIAPGQVSDHLWYFPDVLPTLAQLAGADVPKDVDGISIVPLLLGKGEQPKHEYLYWELNQQTAVRMGNWKAIQPRKNAKWELYDLSKDLSEKHNVAEQHADILARMQAYAMQAHTPAAEGTFHNRAIHERDRRAKFGRHDTPPSKDGPPQPVKGRTANPFQVASLVQAQPPRKSYRLAGVDLKQRVIWGAECRHPGGSGLAFGGQDQDADDGRPHTRLLIDGQWKSVLEELRKGNPLQPMYLPAWNLRTLARNMLARARFIYFKGLSPDDQKSALEKDIQPLHAELKTKLNDFMKVLGTTKGEAYENGQVRFALGHLKQAGELLDAPTAPLNAGYLKKLHRAQIHLELAAEAFDAEPPPRAVDCGSPRGTPSDEQASVGLVYDSKSKLYILFGGDHLDYLTNDTWVFDAEMKRWYQRHPEGAPPPRANHVLKASDDKVSLVGGYAYTSNTDYVGGQYTDLQDGPWTYDIENNKWSGGELVPADSRTYRTGPFHPDYYLEGDEPNAATFAAWLDKLPANRWVETNPPYRPRLNRDWGCARLDPYRDLLLRWSGGHSAHGGTDVPHFHFSTNRWELPFPVEFPLGQLYSNTSYPDGFNFNLRPWMTGHTYQNYAYDPPSKTMVKAGRPRHFYIYDPDFADWVSRGEKPGAMQYNSCFYTLTLTATPHGAVCWDQNGRVHRFDHQKQAWIELKLTGDKLPGAYVDNSCITYDSKRDRVLIFPAKGYQTPYDGQVYAVDMKTSTVKALSPEGSELAPSFAYIDRCCYDPDNDLVMLASYLKDRGERTPTPVLDCKANRWITLDIDYAVNKRGTRIDRAFPHGRSCGLVYDEKRKLFWGTDTNSQIYVLRLER